MLRHTSREVRCIIEEVLYKTDINSLEKNTSETIIGMNDIACIRLKTVKPLYCDNYRDNRINGSFVLVDESSNETVAAGMIQNSIHD